MTQGWAWLSVASSVALLLAYELRLRSSERRQPGSSARAAHAQLRSEWSVALSTQPGSELLAVQTLRNSLMSATISASTAALALMGTVSLLVSSGAQRSLLGDFLSPRSMVALLLLATLLACYVCSAFAMRYFNHAGFVMSLPVGCKQRARLSAMAELYVRRAGLMYSWGLRCFLLVVPSLAGLAHPFAMPAATVVTLLTLRAFDRAPTPLG